MSSDVIRKIDRVESQFTGSEFGSALSAFKFDCELRNLSNTSIACYHERLAYLFANLEEQGFTLTDATRRTVQDYIMSLKGSVSDETINGRIRVYRRFFNFLVDEGLWEGDSPMAGIKLLKTAKKVKPVVEPDVAQRILSSINKKTFEGNRNLVMVLLMWDGMLRKKEVLGLKLTDINLDGRLIKVFGKGRKERMVPLGVKTVRVLHQFLIRWRSKFPGDTLICMRNGEPVTERHCHKIIQQIGRKNGVELYPHLLRHSAATWYIRQGGNPVVLQGIMGHSSLTVTQQYLHLSSKDAVESYNKFSPANALRL
jgi:site-specific recombinase XerD